MKLWLLLVVFALGCSTRDTLQTQPCGEAAPGVAVTCEMDAWSNRAYDAVIPDRTPPSTGLPVVIALHGGGGNRKAALRTTCPQGDIDAPECLHTTGTNAGYLVVSPDGTAGGFAIGRTWNAGGGTGSWRCTSGFACEENIDDVKYFDDLLEDLDVRFGIDRDRVFVTGLSNGAAMAHRLACQRADKIAAIAPIGGALQYATGATCEPTRPVAILDIHGSDDPCWKYAGGESDCPVGQSGRNHVGVESSMTRWASIFGCVGEPQQDTLPDNANDQTTSVRRTWQGCGASLQLIRIDGGGHTCPSGEPYLGESVIGRVAQDFGNEVILGFFDRFPE